MKRFIGESAFIWFLATITNINDPDKLGQCQIRIDNFHDDYEDEDLPWAMPLLPITSASYQTEKYGEVGTSPTGILVGSYVFGFFADGSSARVPIIAGSIPAIKDNDPKKHDVPKEAREINTWLGLKKPIGPEPETSYAAKYPYNKVTRTLSGHVIEVDDTPNAERIHVYHKSGTYVEISADGKMVSKIAGNDYKIVAENETIYVEGKTSIAMNGDVKIYALQNAHIQVLENADLDVLGDLTISVGDNLTLKSGNEISLEAAQNLKINAADITITGGSSITTDAPAIFNN